jgi:hypothetical protein
VIPSASPTAPIASIMGLPTAAKRHIIASHPSSFSTVEEAQKGKLPTFRVVIQDATYLVKYIGPNYKSGEDYVRYQVLRDAKNYFDAGAKRFFMVFDMRPPTNKHREHQKRYGGLVPSPTPGNLEELFALLSESSVARVRASVANASFGFDAERKPNVPLLVLTDLVVPNPSAWKSIMANAQLRAEMMHYVTRKIVGDGGGGGDVGSPEASGIYGHLAYGGSARPNPTGSEQTGLVPGLGEEGFVPPAGSTLYVHGGRTERPRREGEDSTASSARPCRRDVLVAIRGISSRDPTCDLGWGRSKRSWSDREVLRGRDVGPLYPEEEVERLGEGELACMYYSLKNLDETQLIVTSDGDLILVALLASRMRLAPNGELLNSLFLLLTVSNGGNGKGISLPGVGGETAGANGGGGSAAERVSASASCYVDVNSLYKAITGRGPFSTYVDPVATYVGALILMGNDYMEGFAPGLAGGINKARGEPWLFTPLTTNPKAYRDMIKIVANDKFATRPGRRGGREDEGESRRREVKYSPCGRYVRVWDCPYDVSIREDAFRAYTLECYFHKHKDGKAIRKEVARRTGRSIPEGEVASATDRDYPVYLTCIRDQLGKTQKNAVMDDESIAAYRRRLEWILTYWTNAYVGGCAYPDPCERLGKAGLPYYGWELDPDDRSVCRYADKVVAAGDVGLIPPYGLPEAIKVSPPCRTPTGTKAPIESLRDGSRRSREKTTGRGEEEATDPPKDDPRKGPTPRDGLQKSSHLLKDPAADGSRKSDRVWKTTTGVRGSPKVSCTSPVVLSPATPLVCRVEKSLEDPPSPPTQTRVGPCSVPRERRSGALRPAPFSPNLNVIHFL